MLRTLAIFAVGAASFAQEVRVSSGPYVPFRIQAESNLVQIGAVVRDAHGRAVSGLTRADFKVFGQGKERPIAAFSAESHAAASAPESAKDAQNATKPRFIALYFDDFGTPAGDLARVKSAAARFVNEGMGTADRAAIFLSSGGRVSAFTADKPVLLEAIEKIAAHPKFSENGVSRCPRITPWDAYLIVHNIGGLAISAAKAELRACTGQNPNPAPTSVVPRRRSQFDPESQMILAQAEQTWDTVRAVSQDTLAAIGSAIDDVAKAPGERVLLLVSSGFLTGSLENQQEQVVDRALRAGVVINALDAKGMLTETPGRDHASESVDGSLLPQVFYWETISADDQKEAPTAILSNLAAATGGLFFHHNNDFSEGLRELVATPESGYVLAIHPDELTAEGKYHKLKVELASRRGDTVQARPGYFAIAKPESKIASNLDQLVASLDTVRDFDTAVSIQYGSKLPSGATPVQLQIHVDLKSLQFPLREGLRTQRLIFVAALIDGDGRMAAAREASMEFALGEAKFASLSESGVNATLGLQAAAGKYRLRLVTLESVEAKAATLAYAIEVP